MKPTKTQDSRCNEAQTKALTDLRATLVRKRKHKEGIAITVREIDRLLKEINPYRHLTMEFFANRMLEGFTKELMRLQPRKGRASRKGSRHG
jgi:hypothetical protein